MENEGLGRRLEQTRSIIETVGFDGSYTGYDPLVLFVVAGRDPLDAMVTAGLIA